MVGTARHYGSAPTRRQAGRRVPRRIAVRNDPTRSAPKSSSFVPNRSDAHLSPQNAVTVRPSSCRDGSHRLTSVRMGAGSVVRAAGAGAAVVVLLAGRGLSAQSSDPRVAELEQRLNACTHLLRDWAGL